MASSKINNIAIIMVSFFMGGLALTIAYPYWHAKDNQVVTATERKILFWYDPMKPDVKFDKPGKSPFMDMDLVPKYAEEVTGKESNGMVINPTLVQNLGLKTASVTKGKLQYSQTIPANVGFNDYQFVIVQARAEGFVEKVYSLTQGDEVKKGTPLIDVTIPQWVEAQSEYLLLAESGAPSSQLKGILERLRLAGMPNEDIQRLRQSRTLQSRFTIRAPIDGVITAFNLRTGMNLSKDNVIAQIQGIDPVWISAAIPESMASLLAENTQFAISIPAYPTHAFQVEKWSILPSVDPNTRTLQVRLQVSNPDALLKPGMNAYLQLSTQGPEGLLIPSPAVIDTGSEQRVITVDRDGLFVPKIIKVSHESHGQTSVAAGLTEGESVVVNGLFLIDSEANISGALERMRSERSSAVVMPPVNAHSGH